MAELEYTRDDGIATILLNRPERKNAFTLQMVDDWVAALQEAQRDTEVRVLVLRGAGDSFCSGVDLKGLYEQFGDEAYEQREAVADHVQRIPLTLADFDKPVIASIT